MIITVERSGGFAGIRPQPIRVDTDHVPPEIADAVHRAIEDAGLLKVSLREEPSSPPQPDRFQYKITVNDGDREHVVRVAEGQSPQMDTFINSVKGIVAQNRTT